MDYVILPRDIILLIAKCRPDAWFKLIQSCKSISSELLKNRDDMIQLWVRRKVCDMTIKNRGVKIYAGVCPNKSFHGECKYINVQTKELEMVCNYHLGVLHGRAYDTINKRKRTYFYNEGKLHGVCKVKGGGYNIELCSVEYKNGVKDGVKDGEYKCYYISGGLQCRANYVNGKLHGLTTHYCIDRERPCLEEEYKKGILHGDRIFYNENGVITRVEMWVDGFLREVKFTKNKKEWNHNPGLNVKLYDPFADKV
ncbi:MORN-repeat protein [Orpheovirus IHUMI-LCC2]|uniref:MORN-repeat protein n=1 Tax=Orpheovirus IHUMI-LCC2 TaxID=2023057 RepID=A0A2I2L5I6_9VIRU|nr:MORN-repeat protein [Orpheovirus IHUMI-LCC2]SNW62760.1 MORN-repeat protein [Orpheovirus IHUMI-LCC2]